MAREKFRWSASWPLSFTVTLYLLLIFVQGNEETEEAYRSGKNLALEYFLPINSPQMVEMPGGREKRDVEGSGLGEAVFSVINQKGVENDMSEADSTTQSASVRLIEETGNEKSVSNLTNIEGSGEVENASETLSEVFLEDERHTESLAPIAESETTTMEVVTTTNEDNTKIWNTTTVEENSTTPEAVTEENSRFTEIISDKTEDVPEEITSVKAEEFTTIGLEFFQTDPVVNHTSGGFVEEVETTTEISSEYTTLSEEEFAAWLQTESTTESNKQDKTTPEESTTVEVKTSPPEVETTIRTEEISTLSVTEPTVDITRIPSVIPEQKISEQSTAFTIQEDTTTPIFQEPTTVIHIPAAPKDTFGEVSEIIPATTEGLPDEPEQISTTRESVVEQIFTEVKIAHKNVEASPGNILQKENLTLGADPLLIVTNTRLMDSEETVQLSSAEPKRLGAYIVIGLILLSFSSLVGYITFRKRMHRKRQDFEGNQECHDTEKALLSLSDYKDNSEIEENHLKNNEITPIVVKSNSQINKFEKNTNFSSPKNLNTIANEKNIEKDNVLKSTTENLTQVIIEDSPKDVEEDKNVPCMERLIVKTRIDQDSIPKKPIIVNRSSAGYMSLPQDG